MSTHVRNLLGGALERGGISQQVLAARIVDEALRVVRKTLGPDAARLIYPTAFSQGELRFRVSAPIASVELHQHEQRLLAELRKKFPGTKIERLTTIPTARGRKDYRTTTER